MDLFDRVAARASEPAETSAPPAPLADRMRPSELGDLIGHAAHLGPETPLGRAIVADRAPSMILWGPPGCGKTTVARIVAAHSRARFQSLSAVTAGIADVRAVIGQAEVERRAGRKTILFIDEIHRFNRAQQDALLPHVENGTVTLIGATTENPSFAVTSALLSRSQVVRLDPLSVDDVVHVLEHALHDRDRGVAALGVALERDSLEAIARWADGDARKALTLLEHLVNELHARGLAMGTREDVEAAARDRTLRYDRAGEEHYNLASAFIKSMRGSDPDAALYWAIRMIEAGEDPLFVLRRMMIFAAEDIGLADPRALEVATTADHAFQRVGLPEGLIPIAFAVTYLAVAPKSKAAYLSLRAVQEEIARSGTLPVPMRIRNAPTAAMKAWGYGEGYRDPQAEREGFVPERYLPETIASKTFYQPTQRGWESKVAEHLNRIRSAAEQARKAAESQSTDAAREAAESVAGQVVANEPRGTNEPEKPRRRRMRT